MTSGRALASRRERHCLGGGATLHSRLPATVRRPRWTTDNGKRVTPLDGSFDFSVLFDEYRDEARQQLDLLDAALLAVERAGSLPDEERSELLRALHTLKGNSGMLGLTQVRDSVHALEEVFRSPPREWPQPLLDGLFTAAAAMRRAVEQAGKEGEAEAFERLAAASLGKAGAVPTDRVVPEPAAAAEAAAPTAAAEATPQEAASAAGETTPAAPDAAGELLRVPFVKLDALLARITQLIEVNSTLEHVVRSQRRQLRETGLWRPLIENLERSGRIADDLQAAAMEMRLVPIGRVLGRFPSLARELAREQGKRVQVVLEGEGTELDKSTVDALGEPLLHLIRNAVDHGIEAPEEREASGKPPEGTLRLRATPAGDRVRIEVEDDGHGLDRRRIRSRAQELGLIDPGAELEPAEIDALIFHPGFTTRRQVSTTSGRGIGLDVVVRSIARLRGSLEVEPGTGGGTRFILHLPLTLLVLPVLLFESEGEMLALPVHEVDETLRAAAPRYVGGVEVVHHGPELIPLARPARIFGWRANGQPAPGGAASSAENGSEGEPDADAGESVAPSPRFAIVVRRGVRAAAVAADRLIDQRDVVVKALPSYLGQPHGVSGASVAPSGRVILLLDAGGIIDLNFDSHRRERRAR